MANLIVFDFRGGVFMTFTLGSFHAAIYDSWYASEEEAYFTGSSTDNTLLLSWGVQTCTVQCISKNKTRNPFLIVFRSSLKNLPENTRARGYQEMCGVGFRVRGIPI